MRLECALATGGQGPSDQASFYAAGVPVLHFDTGSHGDYHKPSDTAAKINVVAAAIGHLTERLVVALDAGLGSPTRRARALHRAAMPAASMPGHHPRLRGPLASRGPARRLRAAGRCRRPRGMRRGDILVRLGQHPIRSVEDLMYALNAFKPGETVTAVVVRQEKETALKPPSKSRGATCPRHGWP